MRLFRWAGLALALILAASGQVGAREFIGTVTKVRDGDTLEVNGVAIRLKGVAAPERSHPLGLAATRAMRDFALGQRVTCWLDGTRSHDRIVALCERDGVDLGAYLIVRGLARDCPRFSGGRYAALEHKARRTTRIRELYPLPGYCF